MANTINEDGASFISKLSMNGTVYTIKDAWARAEISEIESAIAGGVHFRGVAQTAIADGDSLKAITLTDGETVIAIADQKNGDIFIYNNGSKNLEFVVSGGKYSEFGSTGELGALAFADTASGTATVDVAGAITFNDYTPQVGLGTLSVTSTTGSVSTTDTPTAATAAVTVDAFTVAGPTLTVTAPTSTFSALSDVTYNGTDTLTITSVTSDAFVTSVTATAASQTITPTASVAVTYDKVSASGTFLASAGLNGDLAVTAAAPTATITNPTVTVTVSPVSD